MSQALEIPAFSAFRLPAQDDFAPRAPPIVVARRSGPPEAEAQLAAKIEAIDVSGLGLPPRRPRRAFGLGAAASIALHGSFVLAALLWSQSQVERAPEPLAVEIVVERAPDPAPPAAEPQPPAVQPPVAEVAPPSEPSPPPPPVAVETPPPAAEAPPPPPPEPIPTAAAVAETPRPVIETPPPPPEPTPTAVAVTETPPPPKPTPTPVAKVEPPKPTPAPKKAERPAPTKPKPSPKPAESHDAAAQANQSRTAAPAASGANVGDYANSVYARIQARQHYPEAARETGAHGTAVVSFVLDETGQLRSVAILQSSGDSVLDADAIATVRRSAPFGPPPPGARREYPVKLRYHLQ